MPKLIFTGKDFADRSHDLALERTTVGRGPTNAMVIHDKSVSEHHCEILVSGSEVIVRDLNSTNGTFVDGVPAAHQLPVKHGQLIRFGSVEARLVMREGTDPTGDETATGMTAVHAFKRYVEAPSPAPVLEHDSIVPVAGPGPMSSNTMVVTRTPIPPSPAPSFASPRARKKSVMPVWLWAVFALLVAWAVWHWLLRSP